jgi:hypothetical protein
MQSFVVVTATITLVSRRRGQFVPYEELVAAWDETPAAEKQEARNEGYTQVGMGVTRGVRLASVLDRPSVALDYPRSVAAVAGASVSPAVRCQRPQQGVAPIYTPLSANRCELSQQEPNRLRLIPAAG